MSLMSRAKRLGPVLKLVLCISVLPVPLILWPVVGIVGSIIGGAAYGFFSPIFATFDAVGVGKTRKLYHCFYVCLQSMISFLYKILYSHVACHKRHSFFYCICRMELRTLLKGPSLLSGILGMFVTIPTSQLWMTYF